MKAMKKVLAFVLALAMVVTAVPVTNAAAKTANLSAGKTVNKSYYTGKTHTLKLTGVTKADAKKTTWKSSNAKVVKIVADSQTKVSAQFKCVKKGTATVTATVTLKNGKTKTYKAKITVKAPTLTVSPSEMNLTVGETKAITVKKTPAGATLKYSSSDPGVASISGKKITAKSAGKATITVQLTNGTKKITKKVDVTVSAAENGLTATLFNPFSPDYENVVLVGQNAMIDVQYVEDGKPVAGKSIVMTIDASMKNEKVSGYEVVHPQMVTDANGIASFVIRYPYTKGKITGDEAKKEQANIPYVVQVQGDNQTKKTGYVAFASVEVEPTAVKVLEKDGNGNTVTNLVPGLNFTGTKEAAVVKTADMADPATADDEYVMSQQVSPEGSTDHSVTFKVEGGYPKLVWPASIEKTTATSGGKKTTDKEAVFDSKAYHVYTNGGATEWNYTLKDEYNKGLIYATIHFTGLKLSAHTKLMIECLDKDKKTISEHNFEIKGESAQESFDYQIPKDDRIKHVKAYIVSEGQVDLGMNSGYTVDGVTYVYENDEKAESKYPGGNERIKDAKIEWSLVKNPFTAEKEIYTYTKDTTETDSKYGIEGVKGEKLTEMLPAFPYTGTAVLTKYDANGNPRNYYAVETKNGKLVNDGKDKDGKNTVNTVNTNVVPDTGLHVYEINKDELRNYVGEITNVASDGYQVTVNSKDSGRSTLVGTITIDGKALNDGNEPVYGESYGAKYGEVYTSVLWNPVPNDPEKDGPDESKGFVALLGQEIEVIAQLTDRNGNSVTKENETLTFSYADACDSGKLKEIASKAARLNAYGLQNKYTIINVANAVKVVDLETQTDKNGQGKITLTTGDIRLIKDLQVKCSNNNYNVKLLIKNQETGKYVEAAEADLYWIDADISFVTSAITTEAKTVETSADKPKVETGADDITPKAGSNWEYGVKTSATYLPGGYGILGQTEEYNGWININDLDVQMSKAAGVGTVTAGTVVKNSVTANSDKAGLTQIVSKIDEKTDTSKITIASGRGGIYAGTGSTSINKRLTLNVNWKQNGIKVEFITPNGANIYDRLGEPDSIDVYVKVTDTLGNPMKETTVEFTKDTLNTEGVEFVAVPQKTTVSARDNDYVATTTTDENGIAKVTMKQTDLITTTDFRTTVSAKVKDLNGVAQIYTWIQPEDAVLLSLKTEPDDDGNYVTTYDNKTGVITLTFTADIVETSLLKEMITAIYTGPTGDTTQFVIKKDVVVNKKVVSITVDNPIVGFDARGSVEVTIAPKEKDGITYIMTSEDGMQYAPGVFVIEADTNTDVPVKETTHAVGFADAFTNELQAEIDEIAKTTVNDGDKTLSLKAFYEKSADPGIIGVGAQAQVTWESSNGAVVEVTADPVSPAMLRAADAEVTTGGATGVVSPGAIQSYTAKAKAAGIALLTATIRKYNLEGEEVGAAEVINFVVTTDANGFVSMVKCVENANGEVPQTEATAIGGMLWGVKTGLINLDRTSSTPGIPPINTATALWGKFTVQSTNEQLINLTFGNFNQYGNPETCTLTAAGTGTATLTIKVEHAYAGQGRDFTLIYDVDVTDGVVAYKRLEIKAV